MPRTAAMLFTALWMLALTAATPARADYAQARASFEAMDPKAQTGIALALIASGDFEALAQHGFTRFLYRAILAFERREGFRADGVLQPAERARLKEIADSFYARLGSRYYTHPDTGARLLVPRRLFDTEKTTPEGMLFTRRDGMFSLIFLSFPARDKSFDELWRTLSAGGEGKRVIYKRRFATHFVATGYFNSRKFYTWMTRTGASTTGFTLSWGQPWEEMGRKVSTFLANAYGAEQP